MGIRKPTLLSTAHRALTIAAWLVVTASGCADDVTPAREVAARWLDDGPVCGTDFEFNYRPADASVLKDFALVHDGARFHLIAMRPGGGWMRGGAIDFAHGSSVDLVTWDDHPILDLRRPVVAEDHVWAPHVIRHDDRWWMFYTGVTYDEGAPEHNVQRILAATSEDLEHWSPTSLVLDGDPTFTLWGSGQAWGNDLRDPMLWRDDEGWVLFATVRLLDGAQCIAIARSTDLTQWTWIGPLAFTAGQVAESPTMVRYRGRLWLFWTAASEVRAASTTCVDCEFRPEPFELLGYANETLALADGSVLVPRIRAHAVAFARMLPDATSPPRLSTVVSPLCFDGDLLIADPTVVLRGR